MISNLFQNAFARRRVMRRKRKMKEKERGRKRVRIRAADWADAKDIKPELSAVLGTCTCREKKRKKKKKKI